MAIDASIPLSYRPTSSGYVDINKKLADIETLNSLIEQREMAQREARGKEQLTRIKLMEDERSSSARRTAGLKATKGGKLDREMYLSELLAAGEIDAARNVAKDFASADKDISSSRKTQLEAQANLMSQGHSMVQGVDELGRKYGYDHPTTIQANRQALTRFNQMAEQVGMQPVPITDNPLDPKQLAAAMEHFKSATMRLDELKALPESVRAGIYGDRMGGQSQPDEMVETNIRSKNMVDVDAMAPESDPAATPGVEVQTFDPEQIRPLEEGGNIPGSAPQILGQPEYDVSTQPVDAPAAAQRPSLTMQAVMNSAKGKPSLYSWDPATGEMVRNEQMYQDQLALNKARASNITQSVQQRELDKEAMKTLVDDRNAAVGTQDALHAIESANQMLDKGIYTGSLAEWRLKAGKFAGLLGGDTTKEANTEEFLAHIGEVVIPQLKMFGGNDSNEELRYLQSVYAGRIDYEAPALRRILESAQKKMQRRIEMFNKGVGEVRKEVEVPGNIQPLEIPKAPVRAAPPGSASTPVRKYNPATGRIE